MVGIGWALELKPRHVFERGVGEYAGCHRRLDLGLQQDKVMSVAHHSRMASTRQQHGWTRKDMRVPNVTDKATVISLAEIASNAYIEVPGTEDWITVGSHWNTTDDFGWNGDGVRGHVWADEKNTTLVIGLKGTTLSIFTAAGQTSPRDKVNDNLLFSCCCARVSYYWSPVCDCFLGANTCNVSCLEAEVQSNTYYYAAALDIYNNVTALYPRAEHVWVVGHSLGGALSSLLALTFGVPCVTFQAPGDLLAAQRLHLPLPPGLPASEALIWHFGHTADPIFMGTCTGPGSACWYGGYALETGCHTGMECVYDTVLDKGWRVNFVTHRIKTVIKDVLKVYNSTPECKPVVGCRDCYQWDWANTSVV